VALDEVGARAHAEQRMDKDATAGARRIERPDDGFALTFPLDWDVEITNDWHTADVGLGDREFREVLVGRREPLYDEYCGALDLAPMAESPPGWVSLDNAISWASD
jgi:hypothetical protein